MIRISEESGVRTPGSVALPVSHPVSTTPRTPSGRPSTTDLKKGFSFPLSLRLPSVPLSLFLCLTPEGLGVVVETPVTKVGWMNGFHQNTGQKY